jgi:hypothetical protein
MKNFCLVISIFLLVNCSKKPLEDPTIPDPEPPPVVPELPVFTGEDTLLKWTKVFQDNDANFDVIQFPSKDTGHITDNYWYNIGRMKTTFDGGKTWSAFIGLPKEANVIRFISGNKGYAFRNTNGSPGQVPLATTSDGWKSGYYVFNSGLFYTTISDLSIPSDTVGYFFTRVGQFVKFSNPKLNKAPVFTNYGYKVDHSVYHFYFPDVNNGWVITAKREELSGEKGSRILRTTDNGMSWTAQMENEDLYFKKIFFTDKDHGWVTTYSSIIYRTLDGGKNWIKTDIKKADGSKVQTHKIYFLNANHGFMTSTNEILETVDGGATWKRSCKVGKDEIRDITFTAPNILWANGYKGVYKLVI